MREHTLFVEKYRPDTLDNYIGNEHLKSKVEGYLKSGDVPHLLLYGGQVQVKPHLLNLS